MKSNFNFLDKLFPTLGKLGSLAENYLYSDPNSCLIKLGTFAELIVNYMFELDNIKFPEYDNTHANRIKIIKNEGLLPKDIDDILYSLRNTRNKAVHGAYDSLDDCKILLEMAYNLSIWFMLTYGQWDYTPSAFMLPKNTDSEQEYTKLLKEKQELEEKLELIIKSEKPLKHDNRINIEDRKTRSALNSSKINLSEKETRYLIDEQLRKVGWEADTETIRYSKGTRPLKNKNLAIAEWPTNSKSGERGFADYALFAGLKLVGIVEAKRSFTDIPSVIDYQCKDYAKAIKAEHSQFQISTWGEYKAPFLFATNGRPYLKQIDTKSGIWFLDVRNSFNIPKALQGWISPDGMLELLEKDIEKANETLTEMPYDLLYDKSGLNLRDYQIRAIEATEEAIKNGKQTALLAMATGTGKTRTILGMIYRFLKSDRFKRVLFLVDRTALGEQAQDVFKEVKIEELMTINNIYDIKNLEDKDIEKETRIHIATVQSLVKRILYNEGHTMPSVTDYDLIIVDEAHRGYILDKELSDDELLYRNQNDYVSKYRTVIEFFDAVKVALTATPALHTTEIFGKPVFNYSYREAVIEGYLTDHDAPHSIKTKLNTDGIIYDKGETLALYDPITGEITNSDELGDEIKFDVESFNRKVITPDFNKTVLQEIAQDINPEGTGKTLIYAVDDQHADLITDILKKIYEEQGVDNDAIMKITGSIANGNKKKISQIIKRFKNEKYPSIVVTVDLLTTGIDVPEITTLVFMRRVKSRILFEQMLGRATRLCPEINKTHFEIYDPVGVYESLDAVSTMKPISTSNSTTFEDLLNGLEILETEKKIANQVDLIIAKMQRKQRNMSDKEKEYFESQTGGKTIPEFVETILKMPSKDAKEQLLKHKPLFNYLNEIVSGYSRAVVISDKEDKLISHTRGYGSGLNPKDYLDEFNSFVSNNINAIAALKIICTRPKELTRESLKALKLELDRNNFTEKQLNTAWHELKNEDITADIISFIRRCAIGSVLISHEERIKNAVGRLKAKHSFSKMELDWLTRIEKTLLTETVLDRNTFETGSFKTSGGFEKLNKVFKGNLENIMQELNDYLYDDGGEIA